MNEREILETIEMFAHSQGFYGRLLNDLLTADPDTYREFMDDLIAQNFGSVLDLVLYLEC